MKHIVGFSGGIDSQAVLRWVRNRFPSADIIATNSNAGGWEDPLTEQFIHWYSENQFPVTRTNAIIADMWKTPGFAETKGLDGNAVLTFEEMVRIKGRPPSRKAQFCTEKLKLGGTGSSGGEMNGLILPAGSPHGVDMEETNV